LEGALVQAHLCVLEQLRALGAELLFGFVLILAVYVNHGVDGFFLSRYSGVFSNHLDVSLLLFVDMVVEYPQISVTNESRL
jgi:hypothetical protein